MRRPKCCGDCTAAAERLLKHPDTESAERVKQTIRKLLAAPEAQGTKANIDWDLPPVNIPLGKVPLPAEVKPIIAASFEKAYTTAQRWP